MRHVRSRVAIAVASTLCLIVAGCGGGGISTHAAVAETASGIAGAATTERASATTDAPAGAITWTQLESATAGANGAIVKASGGWYSAAVSTLALQSDGVLEFRANDVGTNPTVNASRVCLDSGAYDVNVPASLDYCVVPGAGYATVYVRGAWSADVAMTTADTIAIAIEGSAVKFRKNGVAFHTLATTPTFPLSAVFSTNFDGYGLTSASLVQTAVVATPVANATVPVVWGSVLQASAGANGAIVKTAGASWYSAATSTQTLTGAGRFEFGVNSIGTNPTANAERVCLDSGTSDATNAATLDYCLVPGAGYATVYVRGAWRADTPIALTDTLAIAIDAGAVRFEKNGTAFYGVNESPAYPQAAFWTTAFDGYGLTKAAITQGVATVPPSVPVTWAGLHQASAGPNGAVVKTPGADWYAFATSVESLAADGVLEVRVNNTGVNPTANAGWICLDSGTHDVLVPASLDYCLVPGAGYATVYVRGGWRADTPVATTDVLDVVVRGGTVTFTKNGTAFYTFADTVSFPLSAVWTTAFDGYGLTSATLQATASAGGAGTTTPASPTSPTTPTDPAAPTTPTAPTPVPTGTSALVAWDRIASRVDGTPDAIVGYRIYYGQDAANPAEFADVVDSSITSARFSALAAGTWYFTVVAVDADGFASDAAEPQAFDFI